MVFAHANGSKDNGFWLKKICGPSRQLIAPLTKENTPERKDPESGKGENIPCRSCPKL